MRYTIALMIFIFSGAACAQEVTLGKDGIVFVWRDGDSMSEGFSLIQAGVHKTNPQLVFRLMSCVVPAGTKAVITDVGLITHTILITEGENAGCRGDIAMEDANFR